MLSPLYKRLKHPQMKKIFVLSCILMLCCCLHAQWAFGPKAGLNIGKEKYGNDFYSTGSHLFFCGGIFGNYSFKKHFAAQAELLYSGEGTAESYMGSGNSKVTGVVTINRLNIPLLFQYRTAVGAFFETGPQLGLLLSAKGKYSTGSYDFKPYTQSLLLSWCIGAGYQLTQYVPGLGINARFVPGLNEVSKGTVSAKTIKSNVFSITAFYAWPLKKK